MVSPPLDRLVVVTTAFVVVWYRASKTRAGLFCVVCCFLLGFVEVFLRSTGLRSASNGGNPIEPAKHEKKTCEGKGASRKDHRAIPASIDGPRTTLDMFVVIG